MGHISAWFGSLTTGMKALVVLACNMLFALLSPLIVPLTALLFIVCIPVVAYRIFRRGQYQRSCVFLLSALAILLVSSGCSNAPHDTPAEQAGSPSNSHTGSEKANGSARDEARRAARETRTEAAKLAPKKPGQAAAQPKPKPKPKPKPAPRPKPKPAPSPTANKNHSAYGSTVTVSRVVDGDTIEISPAMNGGDDVRLIGVDTPETVDPSEEVEPYGPQASAFATRELAGRRVRLEFDEERIDQYDRLLAYIYAGGSMFNEELVRKGYAQAYPYPPNTTYEAKFAAAQ